MKENKYVINCNGNKIQMGPSCNKAHKLPVIIQSFTMEGSSDSDVRISFATLNQSQYMLSTFDLYSIDIK
jgi:hypothetical protein